MILPQKFDAGKLVKRPVASAQTIVKGDVLVWSSGYLAVAASTTEDAYAVAMQDSTTAAEGTEILVLLIDPTIVFEGGCDAVVSIVDRGTRCDLATKATFNPDATSEKIFLVEEIVGAAEVSTTIRGRFSRFTAT